MRYFLDTEFVEEPGSIELISIGLVSEDDRKYYAISKEFNVKKAWNRFDWKSRKNSRGQEETYKDYWIRDNVLKPIFEELVRKDEPVLYHAEIMYNFKLKRMKQLIRKYGKPNKKIAFEVHEFTKEIEGELVPTVKPSYEKVNIGRPNEIIPRKYAYTLAGSRSKPEFYGYYADYDWVVFCWLYGRMIDLPSDFPYYCKDLKQMADQLGVSGNRIKELCPQVNKHNALADASWNKCLYDILHLNLFDLPTQNDKQDED